MIGNIARFLNAEEVENLLRYCRLLNFQNRWSYADKYNDYWADRCIDINALGSVEKGFGSDVDLAIQRLLIDIKDRSEIEVSSYHKLKNPIYSDCFQLIKWPIGSLQEPHADAEYDDHSEHPSPWREYSSIIYLNDNFEGGETYFVNKNLSVRPESGHLLTFPCTLEYKHGVSEVKDNVRYTIASFWTYDKSKSIFGD